jgi:hypothetical protein
VRAMAALAWDRFLAIGRRSSMADFLRDRLRLARQFLSSGPADARARRVRRTTGSIAHRLAVGLHDQTGLPLADPEHRPDPRDAFAHRDVPYHFLKAGRSAPPCPASCPSATASVCPPFQGPDSSAAWRKFSRARQRRRRGSARIMASGQKIRTPSDLSTGASQEFD